MSDGEKNRLRVGELSKISGKTVRALHLYEELGLLRPISRTSGGFREYAEDSIVRIEWIAKLQAIGFSLGEIQHFVQEFESADTGKTATDEVREKFAAKLSSVRDQIQQLSNIETDLIEALAYLETCHACSDEYTPIECGTCDHNGHSPDVAPPLFSTLARQQRAFDVDVSKLRSQADENVVGRQRMKRAGKVAQG